ncbi:uncharacterized protein LOC111715488 [Eurytemora carolleeae]|uniref:uncharacterized protein LOC111715488 n=1 Tax=Eurytemora carolleeae TaxID=1294199 RepID=UPI000C75F1A7|nr:uncharacterized protein LOC111715488 [Eurytemora carolleeae]|eukprot:XP_023346591.1 uncharacterized protein LOC111715488 [Eurytemora affinis]
MGFKLFSRTALITLWTLLFFSISVRSEDDCPEFECPAKDGSFADPCTCRRFYQCVEFFPYKNFCPSNLYWDDIKKLCTFKNEAVCGPVTTTPAPSTTPPPDTANTCDISACQLPYCFCSSDGTQIPGGLNKEDIPQMVMLMLDGAVNTNNFDDYKKLFRERTNPNGCKVKGTFFITHHYSKNSKVGGALREVICIRARVHPNAHIEVLKNDGHEIAVSSISDDSGLYLKNASSWIDELVGMRTLLTQQVDLGVEDILGARAPGLKPGFNDQYTAMIEYGFIWDSSVSALPLATPVWPYTLDYKIPHKCKAESCPSRQFPGLWEIPLNSHHVEGFVAGHCPYLDQCVFTNMDSDDIFEWLKEDFLRHYTTNKAPYTLAMHTNWFTYKEQVTALEKFMNYTNTLDDVYYVTATQALLWMTDPVGLDELILVDSWSCDPEEEKVDPPCVSPNQCALSHTENDISVIKYMTTCKTCPAVYPWLGNVYGKETEEKDVYPKFED